MFNWEWCQLIGNNPTSPSIWSKSRLKPASKIFSVDSKVAAANTHDQIQLLSNLRRNVARQLSLMAATTDRDIEVLEAETYIGTSPWRIWCTLRMWGGHPSRGAHSTSGTCIHCNCRTIPTRDRAPRMTSCVCTGNVFGKEEASERLRLFGAVG